MNRKELVDSILKEVDRVEDEDALEDETQEYRRPRPPKEPSQVYSVRIPVDRLEQLRRVAEQRRMAPSALLREWVVDRLDAEAGGGQVLSIAAGGVTGTLAVADDDIVAGHADALAALVDEVRRAVERARAHGGQAGTP